MEFFDDDLAERQRFSSRRRQQVSGWTPVRRPGALGPRDYEAYDVVCPREDLVHVPSLLAPTEEYPTDDMREAIELLSRMYAEQIEPTLVEALVQRSSLSSNELLGSGVRTRIRLLRFLRYPASQDSETPLGFFEHTDYESFAVVLPSGPGLEVYDLARDRWTPMGSTVGTGVVLVGELAERMSGGRLRAARHRVRLGNQERFSVVCFTAPGAAATVPTDHEGVSTVAAYLMKRFGPSY